MAPIIDAEPPRDWKTTERIKAVVAIMQDYRKRRLRHMIDHPEMVTDDDKVPASLCREAEAIEILRELNLA